MFVYRSLYILGSCLPYYAADSTVTRVTQAKCSMLRMICLVAELGSFPAKERGKEVLLDHHDQSGKYIRTFDQDRLAKRVCIGKCHQTHANTSTYMLQNLS